MTPTSTLHIRPCALEPGEAAVLAGIWRRAWSSAHRDIETLEPIAHWLSRVKSEFRAPAELLVIERENQLLAFMLMQPARRYVAQLYVDTHLQSQGIGGLLLDEADRRMPEGWRLHVATDNPGAQRFYMRCGLLRGAIDRHPGTGRERIEYHQRPARR